MANNAPQKFPVWGLVLAGLAGTILFFLTSGESGFSFANLFQALFVGSLIAYLWAKFAAPNKYNE